MKILSPVAILGFGVEGKYAQDFLNAHKTKDVQVFDEAKSPFPDLTEFSTIIRSPGVPYNHPKIQLARDSGVLITSMTQLTLEACRGRLTAITGSNGKTTTTALVEHILRAHYTDLIVGGNDRSPILSEALENLDAKLLMEVSSFQFSDVTISPHISAVLNITPNHLDWHEDLEDYIHAKNNLIKHQKTEDWCILNANNENSKKLSSEAPSTVFWIGEKKENHYAVWEGDNLVVRHDGDAHSILNRQDLSIKTHPDNILFAAAIAILHGLSPALIEREMKTFAGVEHRLEFVRTVKDINYYNDTSCTTPESAVVAIDQFPSENLILLLGGSSKKAEFAFLASKIVNENVRIYCYGKEGKVIRQAVEEAGGNGLIISKNPLSSFDDIVQDVTSLAKPNDNIVLSPACASFDMFKNAKDRGNQFKEIVNGL